MPQQIESPPSSGPDIEVPDITFTPDTYPSAGDTSSGRPRPALRDVAVIGGLLVAYVVALIAIGVIRVVRYPFHCVRSQQTA